MFSAQGHFVTAFGGEGSGPGELKGPRGLAVDHNGVLYVCDRKNYRIQVF